MTNVFTHCVSATRETIAIQINVLQDGQDFYLIVQNSGPPVPPARVREVMELLQDHERRKDFKGTCNGRGICNIHDRLQLYYGDAY